MKARVSTLRLYEIIPASTQNIEFWDNYRNISLTLKSAILPFCFNGLGVAEAAPRPKHERTYEFNGLGVAQAAPRPKHERTYEFNGLGVAQAAPRPKHEQTCDP